MRATVRCRVGNNKPHPWEITYLYIPSMQLNPISTLYHIAPCCLVFLSIPCAYIEVRILVLYT